MTEKQKKAREELAYSILAFVMAIAFGTMWVSVIRSGSAGVCGGEHAPAAAQAPVR